MALNPKVRVLAHRAGIVLAFIGSAVVTYSLLTAQREPVKVAPTALAAAACTKTVTTVLAKPDGTSKTIRDEQRVDCQTGAPAAAASDGDSDSLAGSVPRVAGKVLLHMLL